MAIEAFGESAVDIDVRDGTAAEHSASHIPDVSVYTATDVHHLDIKGTNPFKRGFTSVQRDAQRGATVLLANTWEEQRSVVLGRPELSRPPGATCHWNRTNGVGHVSAVTAQYSDALAKHFPVYCGLIEALCGTFSPGLCDFIAFCADAHFNDSVHYTHAGYSWSAPSFTTHHFLRISTAFHKGMAKELLRALNHVRARKPLRPGNGHKRQKHTIGQHINMAFDAAVSRAARPSMHR